MSSDDDDSAVRRLAVRDDGIVELFRQRRQPMVRLAYTLTRATRSSPTRSSRTRSCSCTRSGRRSTTQPATSERWSSTGATRIIGICRSFARRRSSPTLRPAARTVSMKRSPDRSHGSRSRSKRFWYCATSATSTMSRSPPRSESAERRSGPVPIVGSNGFARRSHHDDRHRVPASRSLRQARRRGAGSGDDL